MTNSNIPPENENPNDNPSDVPENFGAAGFEEDAITNTDESLANDKAEQVRRKRDIKKANFQAVFGSGVGKIALISAGAVVLVILALGVRGLTHKEETNPNSKANVDIPSAPRVKADVSAVSAEEAKRRAEQGAKEAESAAAKGQSYQPGFDTNIVDSKKKSTHGDSGETDFFVNGVNEPSKAPAAPIQVTTGQSSAGYSRSAAQTSQQQAQAEQQARQQLAQEYKKEKENRDKHVAEIKKEVMKQAELLLGNGKSSPLNDLGSYTAVSYYPVKQNAENSMIPNPTLPVSATNVIGNPNGKLLIKTGNIMYATLDSEVNTDDGGTVLATIRSGEWDGAKLIGKIQQTPNNINLIFSTLAPQDSRKTMKINAIALREEDAKQGVAEDIDHHILERYGSLAVASLMSGYGKAYQKQTGSTVILPGGTVIQQQEEPTSREINAQAVGEMGQAMSQEIRKGFNRPTTYSAPVNQGFGLFFLTDIHEE